MFIRAVHKRSLLTAAVSAAIEAARVKVGEDGLLLDSSVIPNPDKSLWASIL